MKTETEHNNLNKKPSMRRYIIAVICFVLLVVIALVVAALNNKSKPDPESERIIREAVARQLKIDPNELTNEDFTLFRNASIGTEDGPLTFDRSILQIRARELSNIKLLEKFTNLQTLGMNSIKYPESKIPKWMKMVRKFGMNTANRFVIDLTPLEGLTNLQTLSFNGTSIKNIEPLSNLINLKSLDIRNTYVTNLKPLKKLKNLETLYIWGCDRISDKQIKELQKALPNLKITR